VINIKKGEKNVEPLILPYKDAHLKYVIEPEDFLKFLEEPLLKEKIDACLNQIR
jgi:hypothetical protein